MFERVLRISRVINMLGIEFTRVVVFFFYKFDKYTLYKLTQILCKKRIKKNRLKCYKLKQYIKEKVESKTKKNDHK